MSKTGILLVAFGANNYTAQATLALFDKRVREAFPGINVRWAFTSELIRDRLAAKRVKTDSVCKALEKMWFEKYTHVAIQSLHIIPGAEYEDLLCDARSMSEEGRLAAVTVGTSLLNDRHDVKRAAKALQDSIPAERKAHEPVLFMGHGTWHSGDSRYAELSAAVRLDDESVFIGTMDGTHTIDDILPQLTVPAGTRVWLMPLLSVIGRHARQDMAGSGDDSWKTHIENAGFTCEPVLVGAAENEGFVDIWIEHLGVALRSLK